MNITHADVLQKVNDLWNGIGDGARLNLDLDGAIVKIVHPHGMSVGVLMNRHDLEVSIDELASSKLIPALTDLKERVQ